MASPTAGAAAAATPGAPSRAFVYAPLLQIARIRCADPDCGHPSGDPAKFAWFRGLFVLLAAADAKDPKANEEPPPPEGDDAGDVPPKRFTLWQSDENGYLCPCESEAQRGNRAQRQARIREAQQKQAKLQREQDARYAKDHSQWKRETDRYQQKFTAWKRQRDRWERLEAERERKAEEHLAKGLPPPPELPPPPPPPEPPGPEPERPGPMVVEPDLSGLETEFDTIKLVPGQEYLLHLILCPDEDQAREHLKAANEGTLEQEPHALTLAAEVTSAAPARGRGKGREVVEAVFVVDRDPRFLAAPGSELYDGMTLFYSEVVRESRDQRGRVTLSVTHAGMPNNDCPRVKRQVEKLQAHLGAMRFPVGFPNLPYYGSVAGRYVPHENRGIFDVLTYNAVVAFQQAAAEGRAFSVGKDLLGKLVDFENKYAPLPDGAKPDAARELSGEFLKGSQTTASMKYAGEAHGVVDPETAAAIKHWLDSGLRKPGHILVAVLPDAKDGPGHAEWMRDDARERFIAWREAVRDLGWTHTMAGSHVFRDIRDCVLSAPQGKATRSIHKTGLAVDMAMAGYQPVHKEFPVMVEWDILRDHRARGRKQGEPVDTAAESLRQPVVAWRLFGEVPAAKWAAGKAAYLAKARELGLDETIYRQSVRPWRYDPTRWEGGNAGPPVEGVFLDLTAVGEAFGFRRISSVSGWTFGVDSVVQLAPGAALEKALSWIEKAQKESPHMGLLVRRDDPGVTLFGGVTEFEARPLRRWLDELKMHPTLRALRPGPELEVPAAVELRGELENLIRVQLADFSFILTPAAWTAGFPVEKVVPGRSISLSAAATVRPKTGPISLRSGDIVWLQVDGVPRCQEWWHFQYQPPITPPLTPSNPKPGRTLWVDLLAEIGWTKEGLRRVGYPESDMTRPAY